MKKSLFSLVLGLACALSAAPVLVHAAAKAVPKPATGKSVKVIDTVVGKGKPATSGATVTVHYSGWLYSPKAPKQHGQEFDSSVGGEPFTFRLGTGMVIRGWDEGVAGMKVGGKRTLIIPAELGYGARGAGPIPPNANLIFDIELLDVK
jgi:FKBP-type peptidyl-prolyl cis-trans isomerase FkpA